MINPAEARVGVLYPWPGLPGMDRGAARRVGPMIEVLAAHFRQVEVLSPGTGGETRRGNITYRAHEITPAEKARTNQAFTIFDGITHHLWRGRVPIHQRRQWSATPLHAESPQQCHRAGNRAQWILLHRSKRHESTGGRTSRLVAGW
jgi:hypothetical protein